MVALLLFHYFYPVTRGCSYNQCLPLALFIISIFAPSGQSLSSTGSLSGRLGNIFSLHCTLGSKGQHSDLMLPLLPSAQATFRLSQPTVCEEMVIISNYKIFFTVLDITLRFLPPLVNRHSCHVGWAAG